MARKKGKDYLRFRDQRGPGDLDRGVAERDQVLGFYYVERERYVQRAINRDDRASVFIGPKGVGKSAILQMVRNECNANGNSDRIFDIAPDDLAFSALANINATTPLLSDALSNQWLFTTLWDYILSVEILRVEYKQYGTLQTALQRLFGNKSVKQQSQLLRLALSDTGSPRESLTQKMLDLVKEVEIEGQSQGSSVRGAITLDARGERATNRLELLNLINNVAKDLSKTVTKEYYVLVDDLDLHWTGSELQNVFIGALFFSMNKLGKSRNIKFVVALRENIFSKIAIEDRDKLRDIVVRVEWGDEAIRKMIGEWLSFVLTCSANEVWDALFPEDAFETLRGATSGTPREMLRLAAICVRQAQSDGHKRVIMDDVASAIKLFSKERLDDLASEYRHDYPGLNQVCLKFAGKKKEFPIEDVHEIAIEIACEIETNGSLKHSWSRPYEDNPIGLARALLECGFLWIKMHQRDRAHAPTEAEMSNLDKTRWFAVHPMYVSGLALH